MADEIPLTAAGSLRRHEMIAAYRRFREAREKRPERGVASDDPAIEREIWEAIEAAFRAHLGYALHENRYTESEPSIPFPAKISLFVADAISELLAGGEPASWRAFRHTGARSGAPKTAVPEADNIFAATLYISACKSGLIHDDAPNRTICKAFGVAPSTVYGWCRRQPLAPDDFFRFGILRNYDHPALIKALMRYAGRTYQAASRRRSHTAIDRRYRKRTGPGGR